MISKLQEIKGKTKLYFHENISNYYDNMNISFDEDLFAKNAQGISKKYHKVLMLMNFLQTKRQDENMIINYFDLDYTVTKNRDEKQIVDNQYENDYINFNDIVPKYYIGRKINNETLR